MIVEVRRTATYDETIAYKVDNEVIAKIKEDCKSLKGDDIYNFIQDNLEGILEDYISPETVAQNLEEVDYSNIVNEDKVVEEIVNKIKSTKNG